MTKLGERIGEICVKIQLVGCFYIFICLLLLCTLWTHSNCAVNFGWILFLAFSLPIPIVYFKTESAKSACAEFLFKLTMSVAIGLYAFAVYAIIQVQVRSPRCMPLLVLIFDWICIMIFLVIIVLIFAGEQILGQKSSAASEAVYRNDSTMVKDCETGTEKKILSLYRLGQTEALKVIAELGQFKIRDFRICHEEAQEMWDLLVKWSQPQAPKPSSIAPEGAEKKLPSPEQTNTPGTGTGPAVEELNEIDELLSEDPNRDQLIRTTVIRVKQEDPFFECCCGCDFSSKEEGRDKFASLPFCGHFYFHPCFFSRFQEYKFDCAVCENHVRISVLAKLHGPEIKAEA